MDQQHILYLYQNKCRKQHLARLQSNFLKLCTLLGIDKLKMSLAMSQSLESIQLLPSVSITPANPKLLTIIAPKYINNDIIQTIEYMMSHNEEPQFITITMEYNQFWNMIIKHFKGNDLLIIIDNIINSDQQRYDNTYEYSPYDTQQIKTIKKMQAEMYTLANKFWNLVQTQKGIEIPKLRRISIKELSSLPFKHLYQMSITPKVCQ